MHTDAVHAFLFGSDMDPERIRTHRDLPAGEVLGVGWVSARELAGLELPLPKTDELWGVVLQLPAGSHVDGPRVPVDVDGEQVEAAVLTTPGDLDGAEAVLDAASHWSLPAHYLVALGTLNTE
jgi:hypothetical protein